MFAPTRSADARFTSDRSNPDKSADCRLALLRSAPVQVVFVSVGEPPWAVTQEVVTALLKAACDSVACSNVVLLEQEARGGNPANAHCASWVFENVEPARFA